MTVALAHCLPSAAFLLMPEGGCSGALLQVFDMAVFGLLMVLAASSGTADARCAARVDFYQPPKGMISTPLMAVQIARAYLESVYGSVQVKDQLPLEASINREVWHVRGTRSTKPGRLWLGGVAEIDLCQSTGQVLRVYHGK